MTSASMPLESTDARRRRRIGRLLRVAMITVAVVAVASAIIRTVIVATVISQPAGQRPELSSYDERALSFLVVLTGLDPSSAEYARTREGMVRMSDRYIDNPRQTFAHMVPGILILLLAPFQFNESLRRRYRTVHRWTGRLILVMVLISGWTAIYFGVINPGSPVLERPTVAIFSALFLFAAARALYAIRVRDVAAHREWMIRMLAMAVGIGTVRVVSLAVAFVVRAQWEINFVISMWLGWAITLAAAEFWIRHTRPAVARAHAPVLVRAL